MFAIIKTGGKQYRVSETDVVKVEKIDGKVGESVDFKEVLLIEDEKEVKVGMPLVEGSKVTAKIIKHGLGKKIDIVKFKSKVRYRRKTGHRQTYTQIQIEKITA